MDSQEKSLLIETMMGVQSEIAASRAEREKQQHVKVEVHLKVPRVSLDTVLLSLAAGLISAATVYSCAQP